MDQHRLAQCAGLAVAKGPFAALAICRDDVAVNIEPAINRRGVGPGAMDRVDVPQRDVARVEMLYPFPDKEIREVVAGLPNLREIVWLQEEPANMGAWRFVHEPLRAITGDTLALRVVARPERASPAPGTASMYLHEQQKLIGEALAT